MIENHGADGTAHITFFDKASQLSFVWDGKHGPTVAVSHGGYAEPVIETFDLDGVPPDAREIPMNLRWFEADCQAFALNWRERMLVAAQDGFSDGVIDRDAAEYVTNPIFHQAYSDAFKQGRIYASGGMVDVHELAKIAGHSNVDSAIPQPWADDVQAKTGTYPNGQGRIFAWSYSGGSYVFGRPLPLTVESRKLLVSYESLVK